MHYLKYIGPYGVKLPLEHRLAVAEEHDAQMFPPGVNYGNSPVAVHIFFRRKANYVLACHHHSVEHGADARHAYANTAEILHYGCDERFWNSKKYGFKPAARSVLMAVFLGYYVVSVDVVLQNRFRLEAGKLLQFCFFCG